MSKKQRNSDDTKEQKINLENPEGDIIDDIGAAVDEDETAEDIEQAEMNEIDSLTKQLAEEKEKLEKEKKEYMFLMAEFDNFRKRTLKEKSEIIKNASENVLKGLLPIVDDFERGLDAIKESEGAEAVKEGMVLIYNKLVKFLEQNQVKAIDSTGKAFDPELHEAIAMVPTDDEKLKGKVIDTPTKGYTINDTRQQEHPQPSVGVAGSEKSETENPREHRHQHNALYSESFQADGNKEDTQRLTDLRQRNQGISVACRPCVGEFRNILETGYIGIGISIGYL